MKEWIEVTYPNIVKKARHENAEIWWIDETGIRNASNCIKGYAPIGQTPTLPVASHHIGVNMISAITNKGKIRYHFYNGKFNQDIFMEFLTRIIKSTDKKVFIIADNSSIHHGSLVQQWREKNAKHIAMFYLPSYSPDLNPDEYLNNNLKRVMLKKGYSKNEHEVKMKAICTMRSIQAKKKRVESFFDNVFVKYAKSME